MVGVDIDRGLIARAERSVVPPLQAGVLDPLPPPRPPPFTQNAPHNHNINPRMLTTLTVNPPLTFSVAPGLLVCAWITHTY